MSLISLIRGKSGLGKFATAIPVTYAAQEGDQRTGRKRWLGI